MVLFVKLEEEAAYTPVNISPTLASLTAALKDKFSEIQPLQVAMFWPPKYIVHHFYAKQFISGIGDKSARV